MGHARDDEVAEVVEQRGEGLALEGRRSREAAADVAGADGRRDRQIADAPLLHARLNLADLAHVLSVHAAPLRPRAAASAPGEDRRADARPRCVPRTRSW